MSTLERLVTLARAAMGDASTVLANGGKLAKWEQAMERAIATAHTATYLAASAERLKISPDSPLLGRSRLSRAERADITAAVQAQLAYLRNFSAQIAAEKLSDTQIAARAKLYAPAVRSFYYQQRWRGWAIPDELIPGNQQCLTQCRCYGEVIEGEDGTGIWRRTMGETEMHCLECPALEGDHPITRAEV